MQIFEMTVSASHPIAVAYLPVPEQSVFFDIETTGLHRRFSRIYLIGALSCRNHIWTLTQWFAQRPGDEPELLRAFLSLIKDCQTLVHYNGDAFDLPYLQSRCAFHGISENIRSGYASFDIYRRMRRYQNLLGLEKFTQKAAEQFIGAVRTDPYDGGELIAVYKEYLQTADEDLQRALLLHNQEDVLNMTSLLALESYRSLFEDTPVIKTMESGSCTLTIVLELVHTLPKPISCRSEWYSLTADKKNAVLEVTLFQGTLNYYYGNPKDYYYLPAEDRAIHKSIGIYVDREHRRQASAATCYQKQTGLFVPQPAPTVSPLFKKEHQDTRSFFLFETWETLSEQQIEQYVAQILQVLSG